MKVMVLLLVLGLMTGCRSSDQRDDCGLKLRESLIASNSCTFHSVITADYGSKVYTFQLDNTWDNNELHFTVTDPKTICGISGTMSEDQAELTFDDIVLAFPPLSEGMLSPISAPWIFIKGLYSGYIAGFSDSSSGVYMYIDDTYEETPLKLEIRLNQDGIPVQVEYIWQNRRILTADIQDFTIM